MIEKVLKTLLVLIILFVTSDTVFCTQTSIDLILSKIEKQNSVISDIQAEYFQTITYFSTNEKLESEGIFRHKKQNYIYLSQLKPIKQYTYIDGKHITTYIPDNKQAIVEKWKNVINADVLLTSVFKFTKNFKSLKKEYNIELLEETKTNYSFSIKPINLKEKWQMTITVSKSNALITETSFNNGNFVVDVRLTNYKLNNNFSNELFKFTAPKNIDIIEL